MVKVTQLLPCSVWLQTSPSYPEPCTASLVCLICLIKWLKPAMCCPSVRDRSCDWCFLIFSLLLRCFLGWDTGPGPPWPSRTIHRVPVGFRHELANHSAAASTGPCHCLSLSVLECSVCLALGPPPMAGHLCATLSCDLTHLPATESTGCGESRRDHQRQARLQCESCLPSLCASCTHGWDTEPRADPPSPGGSHLHN